MRSPFPGMDPYLEHHWRDVHATLIVLSRSAIQHQLGSGLRARIEERLVVETDFEESRDIYPDVRVFERGISDRPIMSCAVAVAEPLVVKAASQPVPQRHIQIIDTASGGQVITVIEFVSPSNKVAGETQKKYIAKRNEVLGADINLVEIDLTRSGDRELAYPQENLPRDWQTPYLACVYRGFGADQYEFYRMPLREKLPAIRIPLRKTDPDIVLDIQPLVDRAYQEGAYDDIDYRRPCKPPLPAEDESWAAELLEAAGKR